MRACSEPYFHESEGKDGAARGGAPWPPGTCDGHVRRLTPSGQPCVPPPHLGPFPGLLALQEVAQLLGHLRHEAGGCVRSPLHALALRGKDSASCDCCYLAGSTAGCWLVALPAKVWRRESGRARATPPILRTLIPCWSLKATNRGNRGNRAKPDAFLVCT